MKTPSPNDRVTSEDRRVPGPVDAPDVLVRISMPSPKKATMPAILWLHCGSSTFGNLDQDEATCQSLAEEVGGVVVSVDYRLAPGKLTEWWTDFALKGGNLH